MIERMKRIGLVFKEENLEEMTSELQRSGILHINSMSKLKKYEGMIDKTYYDAEKGRLIDNLANRIGELRKIYRGTYEKLKEERLKPVKLEDIEKEVKKIEEESAKEKDKNHSVDLNIVKRY